MVYRINGEEVCFYFFIFIKEQLKKYDVTFSDTYELKKDKNGKDCRVRVLSADAAKIAGICSIFNIPF